LRIVIEIKHCINIEWKVGLCEHLDIRFTRVTDAASFENQTENRIV